MMLEEGEECSICQSEIDIDYMTECGHCYHVNCLQKWIDFSHVECPMCRRELYCDESCWWSDPLKFFKTIPYSPYNNSDLIVLLNCWKVLLGKSKYISKKVSSERGAILFLEYLFEKIYKKKETDKFLYKWIMKYIIDDELFQSSVGDDGVMKLLKFLINHPNNYILNCNEIIPMNVVQSILKERKNLTQFLLSDEKDPLRILFLSLKEDKLEYLLLLTINFIKNNQSLWNRDDLWILRDGWSLMALAAHKGNVKIMKDLNELGMESVLQNDYKKFASLNPISIKGNYITIKGNKKINVKIDPLLEALLTKNITLSTTLIKADKKHLTSPSSVERELSDEKNIILDLILKLKTKIGFKDEKTLIPKTPCDFIMKKLKQMKKQDIVILFERILMVG